MATLPALLALMVSSIVCIRSGDVNLNQRECGLFMLLENYLNSTGYVFIYKGGEEIRNCSLPVNIYHAKGDGICVDPLSWNVKSCDTTVAVNFDDRHAFMPDPDIQKVWNCTTSPDRLCYKKGWARLVVNTDGSSMDTFRIKVYLTGQTVFPRGYNETRTDDDGKDDTEHWPMEYIIAIVVGAVVLVVILVIIAVVCIRRRSQEYTTTGAVYLRHHQQRFRTRRRLEDSRCIISRGRKRALAVCVTETVLPSMWQV